MKTLVLSLALGALAVASAPAGALAEGDRISAQIADRGDVVGRVAFVESCGGWVLVDFPFGRRMLAPDQREVDRYAFHQGKEMVFDRDLRPRWDARP